MPAEIDDLDFGGRVALVTGGASGIGEATAVALAEHGARVVVADIDDAGGRRVAASIGGRFERLDVADPAGWSAATDRVRETLGVPSLAVFSAGVLMREPAPLLLDADDYRRVLGINVDGIVFGVRELAPTMAAAGGGAMVAISSLAGLVPFAPDPVYTLTKHAVVGFTRATAPGLAEQGITFDVLCPGIVDTPLVSQDVRDGLAIGNYPMLAPREIAGAALAALAGSETGRALVCQPGRVGVAYAFRGVPGPAVDNDHQSHGSDR